jgi:hypothetical protein
MAINRLNVSLSGVQPGGLAKVVPTSVAVGSGSGSVDSNGTVTFSGCSSLALNNIFSSSYTNYLVLMDVTPSTSASIQLRFRTTTDDTSAKYSIQHITASSTTITGTRVLNDSVLNINKGPAGNRYPYTMEIFNPNQAIVTAGHIKGIEYMLNQLSSFYVDTTTQYTGFNLIPSTGTISGTAFVYGYAN